MDLVEEEIIIIIDDDPDLDHVIGLEKTIIGSVEEGEVVEIITTMAMAMVETIRITMVEGATIIITTMAVHQEEERENADVEIVTKIATTIIMETIKTTTAAAATTTTMVEMEVSNIRALKEMEEEVVAERMM